MQAERAFRCRDPGGLAIAALQPLSWIRTLGIPVLHSGGARSMGHGHTGKVWTEIMGRGDHDSHDGHDGLDEEQAHAQVHRGQQGLCPFEGTRVARRQKSWYPDKCPARPGPWGALFQTLG